MKKILLFLFLLIGFTSGAQVLQAPNVYGYQFKRVGGDTLVFIPGDTLQVPAAYNSKTFIARKGTTLYYWDGSKWSGLSGGSGSTDTTSLSNRINLKLNISDTAAMLANYRKLDSIWRVAGKDSIYWLKNGTTYPVKDSTGNPNPPYLTNKQIGGLSLSGITKLTATGASWESGILSLDVNKRFVKRAADTLGLTLESAASSGNGYLASIDTLFRRNYTTSSRDNLIVSGTSALLAEALSQEDRPLGRFRYKEFLKTYLANCFLKSVSVFKGNGTAVSGSWTSLNSTAVNRARRMSDSLLTNTTSGSIYRISVTIAQDESIVIGFMRGISTATIGNFNVTVASALMASITGASYPTVGTGTFIPSGESGATLMPGVLILRGYAAGTYTIDIQNTTNNPIYLDYYGVMSKPSEAKPVVIMGATKLPESYYIGALARVNPEINRYVNIANTVVRDAINDDFGDYPVSFSLPENYFVPKRDTRHNDNLHPNLSGDSVLANCIIDAVRYKMVNPTQYASGYETEVVNGFTKADTSGLYRYKWGGALTENTTISGSFDLTLNPDSLFVKYQASAGGQTATIRSNGHLGYVIDTVTLAQFGGGANFSGDTAAFSTDALYGSYFHNHDTLIITSVYAVIQAGATDTLGIQIYFNDSLNTGTTGVLSSTLALTSRPQGHSSTSFSNSSIPPGSWIWCKSPTIVAGRKPEYLSVSLIGYRKRRS